MFDTYVKQVCKKIYKACVLLNICLTCVQHMLNTFIYNVCFTYVK